MQTTLAEDKKTADNIDIKIFNLLRCEPPSLTFDFFSYGGLTASVFRLLQGIGNLEEIILNKSGKSIPIPSSSDLNLEEHRLTYQEDKGVYSILANTYNTFSNLSDVKMFGTTEIKGTDGEKYKASLLALEVYREEGNERPVWELGFYITKNGSKEILYGEEIVVNVPPNNRRLALEGKVTTFILLTMKNMGYNPSLKGFFHNLQESKYLTKILTNEREVMSKEDFKKNRARWFRYLTGTLDIKKVLKFDDLYYFTNVSEPRVSRVELTSSHLASENGRGYLVGVLEDSEGYSKNPNPKITQEGPFTHEEAWMRFLEVGNHNMDKIYHNAGKGRRQFDIALDWRQIDFRYAIIVKDAAGVPITVSSWESPSRNGDPITQKTPHHYIQLWNESPEPKRLDEGVIFDLHPTQFMRKLRYAIPQFEYKDGSDFVEKAIRYGVPLINPKN